MIGGGHPSDPSAATVSLTLSYSGAHANVGLRSGRSSQPPRSSRRAAARTTSRRPPSGPTGFCSAITTWTVVALVDRRLAQERRRSDEGIAHVRGRRREERDQRASPRPSAISASPTRRRASRRRTRSTSSRARSRRTSRRSRTRSTTRRASAASLSAVQVTKDTITKAGTQVSSTVTNFRASTRRASSRTRSRARRAVRS